MYDTYPTDSQQRFRTGVAALTISLFLFAAPASVMIVTQLAGMAKPARQLSSLESQIVAAERSADAMIFGVAAVYFVVFGALSLVFLAVHIGMMVYVARDCRARGVDNMMLWLLFIWFADLVGLAVYLAVRPPRQHAA